MQWKNTACIKFNIFLKILQISNKYFDSMYFIANVLSQMLIAGSFEVHFKLVSIHISKMLNFLHIACFYQMDSLTTTISNSIIRGKWLKCTIGML